MEIAISEPLENFVKQAVREGRYASENDVLNFGIRLVQAREQKLAELRAMIDKSLKDTRAVSDKEMDEAIEQKSRELLAQGIPL
jgi:antitoxin ParD1/3/4